jgi:Tol biopolymer transport system component
MSECQRDSTELARPAWQPVQVAGAVCPDWLVYHTNMTGDWELFRLGDLPDRVQADPNLSRGVGERVFDVMPSTSPEKKWVVFTSNRDSNWEIYISAVEEDNIRRVTYNTTAIDIDPVWSPVGNQIVYESNRDGNWELYLFDVGTGVETRLTNSEGNDVNAAWSFDGEKIAYQSDREGFWQIYELNIATLETSLLSDGIGDDLEPQFTPNGEAIVFRSYRDGENSVIYKMDADGSGVIRLSDPAGDALNASVSPDSRLVAYQSNLDGDSDVYIYEMVNERTRLLTDNVIEDYAPTWWCNSDVVVFTSDVTDDPNLFDTPALPIDAPPILVETEANQLTTDPNFDQYPESVPAEENASREQGFPSPVKNK